MRQAPVLAAFLHHVGLEDFDPVTIRVLDEGDALHLAGVDLLHKGNAEFFQARTGLVDIGNGEPQMAEPLRLFIAAVVFALFVIFRAPVMGQFLGKRG